MTIQANSDFQRRVLECTADILIAGGSAGPGKTFGLCMESSRNTPISNFNGIIFRRTTPQIRKPGSLLDTSKEIFPVLRARLQDQSLTWNFPSGAKINFSHLEHDKSVEDHQGAQYAFIGFDELTYFTSYQFWFLVGRNRSTCGIKPYLRATCNPDADSFVRELVDWWIGPDGYAIEERCGVVRYFIRVGENLFWGDTKQEVMTVAEKSEAFKEVIEKAAAVGVNKYSLIKSFTYIHGDVYQNRDLMEKDPGYLANLLSLPEPERRRFLGGNWNASEDGMNLVEFTGVRDIFSNPKTVSSSRYITCDAAGFGRDLNIAMAWEGWEVLEMRIRKVSDTQAIVEDIEQMRAKWGVVKSNVIVDNDGIGNSTVKIGQYIAFRARDAVFIDKDTKIKPLFDYLKSQCAFHAAEKINLGLARFIASDSNVLTHDGVKFVRSRRILIGGKLWDIEDLTKKQLRTWKREPRKDNTEPNRLNNKDEQKALLGGMSPDIADNWLMRSFFDLRPKPGNVTYNK